MVRADLPLTRSGAFPPPPQERSLVTSLVSQVGKLSPEPA